MSEIQLYGNILSYYSHFELCTIMMYTAKLVQGKVH